MSAAAIVDQYLSEIREDVLGFVEAKGHGSLNLCFQDGRLVLVDSNRKRKITIKPNQTVIERRRREEGLERSLGFA